MIRAWIAVCVFLVGVGASASYEAVPGEYLIKFKADRGARDAKAFSARFGLRAQKSVTRDGSLVLVKGSEHLMNLAGLDESVEYIEPNYIYRRQALPNDPNFGQLWGLQNTGQLIEASTGVAGIDVGAVKAWDITKGSNDVIVAVIDTGVNYKNTDLKENLWVNSAEAKGSLGVDDDGNGLVDDVYGYDFANKDGDPMDDQGHGTHCAGTIAASGDNGVGVVGVAWKARVMSLKFLTASGSGSLADAVMAIDYATENGAHIMSNSWGGGPVSQALRESIERASKKGILFVAAAGNGDMFGNAQNNDTKPMYPASYKIPNVLSVAAIDNKGALAKFSNFGLNSVHVGAPGVKVLSLGLKTPLATMSGTSMATPHVSGIAALLRSQFPDMDAVEMKERIIRTAAPIPSLNGKTVSGGLANAYNALTNTRQ